MLRIHDVVCSQSGAVAETLPAARLRRHQNVKQSDRQLPQLRSPRTRSAMTGFAVALCLVF